MRSLRAQGATEYLVLLAVVLVIALVGIALLGFFPGTANDARIAESQIYWESASPIAIVEWATAGTTNVPDGSRALTYLRVRNSGSYAIRITKLLGDNGHYESQVYEAGCSCNKNMSDIYYLAPGEENTFGWTNFGPIPGRQIDFYIGSGGDGGIILYGLTSGCSNKTYPPFGTAVMNNFGFEYVQYVEGQQITKRQIGSKPLVMKCQNPPW